MKVFLTLLFVISFRLCFAQEDRGIIYFYLYDSVNYHSGNELLPLKGYYITSESDTVCTDFTPASEKNTYKSCLVKKGTYNIFFSIEGYNSIYLTDVVVRPDSITFLDLNITNERNEGKYRPVSIRKYKPPIVKGCKSITVFQ